MTRGASQGGICFGRDCRNKIRLKYLSNYINQARAQGGIPALLTPPTRRKYASAQVLKRDSLMQYAQAMRELGTNMDVPVLDVLPVSIKFYEAMGKAAARADQANKSTNTFENDTTHFSLLGARQQCYFVVECLLHSTNASLAPVQKDVDLKSVRTQATRSGI